MTRLQWLLLVLVGAEVLVGGFLVVHHVTRTRPPLPDAALVDQALAADLQERAAHCTSAEEWRQLADAYMASGFFPEAEACYRHAAKLEPENADFLYHWAFCLSRLGWATASNEQFEQALQQGYKDAPRCWFFMGRNYLREEKPAKAKEAFLKGKELPVARYELARLAFRAENISEALQQLDAILGPFSHTYEPNYLRYLIEVQLGHKKKASHYRDQLALASDRLPTPFGEEWQRLHELRKHMGMQGRLAAFTKAKEKGQKREAEDILRRILRIQWQPAAQDHLADIELAKGNSDEAIQIVEEIIAREGPSTYRLERLGQILSDTNHPDKAARVWEKAANLRSQDNLLEIYRRLYEYYLHEKNSEKSKYFGAQFNHVYGVHFFYDRNWPMAEERLKVAVKLEPRFAHTWYYLGETYRLSGKSEKARNAYQQCLVIDPEHGRAHASLERLPAKKSTR